MIVARAEVARRSVRERVARLKSPKRRRRTTVRPMRRPLRIRRVTRSTTSVRISSGSLSDPPGNAVCEPIERRLAIGADAARVATVRDGVQVMCGVVTDRRGERRDRHGRNLADPTHAELVQGAGGGRANAPEALHRQGVDEAALAIGRNDQDPVGLGGPARHLREGLRAGGADGDGEADVLTSVSAKLRRDLVWRPEDPLETADVEKRLLHSKPLDHGGVAAKDVEEQAARLHVSVEAG